MDSVSKTRKNSKKKKSDPRSVLDSVNIKDHSTASYDQDQSKLNFKIQSKENYKKSDFTNTKSETLSINLKIDAISLLLFVTALITRLYQLDKPRHIVFDELHYGKYVSLYMRETFFFDYHPPFGKQLIAVAAYFANFDGKFKFNKIGKEYTTDIPLFALRFIPALCGSLLMPVSYHFMLELGCKKWTAILTSLVLLCDNALLTRSRLILMEPMLIFFGFVGLYCILKYLNMQLHNNIFQWIWLILGVQSLTLSMCIKYAGIFSLVLGISLIWIDFWNRVVPDHKISSTMLIWQAIIKFLIINVISISLYLLIFYIHLKVLKKAGPHDNVMTSAFQASLEGGLASIIKEQPLQVVHGSQITLRHTHGQTCWLHSHSHLYPLLYPDKRGSSHQQQVTCYTFKDINNWWIVKKPNQDSLVVSNPVNIIKHGDVIQLVHGMTSRALNTHDVAAPISIYNQEVSCYIDYNISMPAQNLWRVDIINKDQTDNFWYSIQSLIRLIHINSNQALKFSGHQLPDWGFYQHEIVTAKVNQQDDTVWNVEEHKYTKSEDEKERERDLVSTEMIPMNTTSLSFWHKFFELQYKMLFNEENMQHHIYSSEPVEWPLTGQGIPYWVSSKYNGQIYLLRNIIVWHSGFIAIFIYIGLAGFYLIRRRRLHYDIDANTWQHFIKIGQVLLMGYLLHYLPYFFVNKTLFLHHYLQPLVFKCMLTAALIEHIHLLLRKHQI